MPPALPERTSSSTPSRANRDARFPGRRSCATRTPPRDRFRVRPLKKWGSALALWALAIVVWPPCLLAWRVLLGGLGSQGGADRVEVDEDGGPEGLEGGFSAAEIATFASVVAVNDQREQSLDQ